MQTQTPKEKKKKRKESQAKLEQWKNRSTREALFIMEISDTH